ncbi:uncharacterized protein PRCAT00001426001 [Priceomyces carsonii]|uniref:uncharacterized protein n=1 Tax=Priceomyces carsonii TaxID=28549 RepID=UPI002EDAEB42|nr:unnamed protein product [Priceomyces carsonii]
MFGVYSRGFASNKNRSSCQNRIQEGRCKLTFLGYLVITTFSLQEATLDPMLGVETEQPSSWNPTSMELLLNIKLTLS